MSDNRLSLTSTPNHYQLPRRGIFSPISDSFILSVIISFTAVILSVVFFVILSFLSISTALFTSFVRAQQSTPAVTTSAATSEGLL
jgi:hypothetical protein